MAVDVAPADTAVDAGALVTDVGTALDVGTAAEVSVAAVVAVAVLGARNADGITA